MKSVVIKMIQKVHAEPVVIQKVAPNPPGFSPAAPGKPWPQSLHLGAGAGPRIDASYLDYIHFLQCLCIYIYIYIDAYSMYIMCIHIYIYILI